MNMLLKTLHLLITTTLIGFTLANYFYYTINLSKNEMRVFVKKLSLQADYLIIFPLLILSFISGTILIIRFGLSFQTPWLEAAFILLTVVLLLQAAVTGLKHYLKKTFVIHCLYGLMLITYLMIIHDAVLQKTYLL